MTQEALEEMRCRRWLGNVRELRNVIEHALIAARGGSILPENLSPPIAVKLVKGSNHEPASREEIDELIDAWAKDALQDSTHSNQANNEMPRVVGATLAQGRDGNARR